MQKQLSIKVIIKYSYPMCLSNEIIISLLLIGMAIALMHIVDKRLSYALSGHLETPVFNKDEDELEWEGVHSIRSCFIMGFVMGKDTIENCKRVAKRLFSFLRELHDLSTNKEYYESRDGIFFTFDIAWPADMKAHQGALERGGGSYMTHQFCLCCDVTNHTKGKQSAFTCDFCKR